MHSLHEVQTRFASAMFAGADDALAGLIAGAPAQAAARLAVYRRNVRSNLVEALRAVYPVIERLVGETFFRHAASEFVRRSPSSSGDIHRYGAGFVQFLAAHPAAAPLVYLADTAQLEWLVHEVFHAAEAPAFDPAQLAAIAPERFAQLRFRLHPACRLLASPYPVHRIWQANQPGADAREEISLAMGGVVLLIARRGHAIELEPLARAEHAMLALLAQGSPLGAALESALRFDEAFDLGGFLRRHVPLGTLVDARVNGSPAVTKT